MSNGHTHRQNSGDLGVLGPTRSGRKFVIGAVIVIALTWGSLALTMGQWKARFAERTRFGEREVAARVDFLAENVPSGVKRGEWKRAVAATHAMLHTVVASGQLDRAAIEGLRDEVKGRLASVTSETAVPVLSKLWDDMIARVGPVLTQRPSRPPFPPARPVILGGKPVDDEPTAASRQPRG